MGEIATNSFASCHQLFLGGQYNCGTWKRKLKIQDWQCHFSLYATKSKRGSLKIKNQMAINSATYSSRISTDIPLYEAPGASFDSYLEDRPRVFKAMFPDKQRSEQLNQEEWRIQMLPISFLFLTVWPVVDMRLRCKSGGKDYPSQVPIKINKVLELDIIRWQLQGIDNVIDPSHFSLGVKGLLYADRLGARTRLKGQLEMNISFVLPPVLALIPEDVRKNIAESVLTGLVQNMKHKVNGSLLADYSEFKRQTTAKNLK
ncbi:uncharacterized protein LOC126676418 [Mercurialis annua]|uniref:uncharacterized protein LOC126676418 n=1 Tax=Mercurialis annua TaxID=3986 RepID=UPI002160A5B1|nr:uncharacterized protein LOC126676418 [Mercurialis annua]